MAKRKDYETDDQGRVFTGGRWTEIPEGKVYNPETNSIDDAPAKAKQSDEDPSEKKKR